jgi:hypothetical protein
MDKINMSMEYIDLVVKTLRGYFKYEDLNTYGN